MAMKEIFGTITKLVENEEEKEIGARKTPYEPPTTRSNQKKNSFERCSTIPGEKNRGSPP